MIGLPGGTVEPAEELDGTKTEQDKALPDGIVVIFVDTNTHNALKEEIDRYISDVKNDLNVDISH